jgi:hypothetical protein
MSTLMLGALILFAAGLAIWQAPTIMSYFTKVNIPAVPAVPAMPAVPAVQDKQAAIARILTLVKITKELEALGAKSAATKLKAALATIVEEDLLT